MGSYNIYNIHCSNIVVGDEDMMNKKGALVLRDIMFMLIIFAGVMALASLFVYSMSSEYENADMGSEYDSSGVGNLGNILLGNSNTTNIVMNEQTSNSSNSLLGSLESDTGAIHGAGAIFVEVLKAPLYVGNSLEIILNALMIPDKVSSIVKAIVNFLIYAIIIFVIISALLKGGKV